MYSRTCIYCRHWHVYEGDAGICYVCRYICGHGLFAAIGHLVILGHCMDKEILTTMRHSYYRLRKEDVFFSDKAAKNDDAIIHGLTGFKYNYYAEPQDTTDTTPPKENKSNVTFTIRWYHMLFIFALVFLVIGFCTAG